MLPMAVKRMGDSPPVIPGQLRTRVPQWRGMLPHLRSILGKGEQEEEEEASEDTDMSVKEESLVKQVKRLASL